MSNSTPGISDIYIVNWATASYGATYNKSNGQLWQTIATNGHFGTTDKTAIWVDGTAGTASQWDLYMRLSFGPTAIESVTYVMTTGIAYDSTKKFYLEHQLLWHAIFDKLNMNFGPVIEHN